MRAAWLLLLALACLGQARAQPAAPAAPPAEVDAGRRVYTSNCVRCHGINLAVGSSAFFDLRTFPKDDKTRFVESVTRGKRAMPAWGEILKPEQIDAVWAYIGHVNGW